MKSNIAVPIADDITVAAKINALYETWCQAQLEFGFASTIKALSKFLPIDRIINWRMPIVDKKRFQ
tara:strand:+ start:78923 stop:79120 length:198 start_codon:yes stop_codon:yes gene_type:complete